jgi:hypothetical protein
MDDNPGVRPVLTPAAPALLGNSCLCLEIRDMRDLPQCFWPNLFAHAASLTPPLGVIWGRTVEWQPLTQCDIETHGRPVTGSVCGPRPLRRPSLAHSYLQLNHILHSQAPEGSIKGLQQDTVCTWLAGSHHVGTQAMEVSNIIQYRSWLGATQHEGA